MDEFQIYEDHHKHDSARLDTSESAASARHSVDVRFSGLKDEEHYRFTESLNGIVKKLVE